MVDQMRRGRLKRGVCQIHEACRNSRKMLYNKQFLTEGILDAMDVDKETFIPGRTKLAPGETLAPDPSTYDMLHTLSTPWPCLSFDIVRDNPTD